MKRIVISAVLLAFCIAVSVYTAYYVNNVNELVRAKVEDSLTAIADADEERLHTCIRELSAFWDEREDTLLHYVRHSQIDDITKSVARLEALTAGGDYSELTAELASIRWQMDHINRSERMVFQNLL